MNKTIQFVKHRLPEEKIDDRQKIHLWFYDLNDHLLTINSAIQLSADEVARVERLKSKSAQNQLTARFAFVRKVLGNITDVAPTDLEFRYGPRGKPQLNSPIGNDLHFNISHSENILAMVVSFGCEVGIDIEVVTSEIDFFSIAKMYFDPESLVLLRAVSHSKIAQSFYRLWTRKEALAKLHGIGIAQKSTDRFLTESLQSLCSLEFNIGKKEIIGAFAFKTQTSSS